MPNIANKLLGLNDKEIFEMEFRTYKHLNEEMQKRRDRILSHTPLCLKEGFIYRVIEYFKRE